MPTDAEPGSGVRQDLVEPFPSEVAARFQAGYVYLIKERQPRLSYGVFNALVSEATPGVCISIFIPEQVRRLYRVRDSRIVWLADTPGDDHVPPTSLTSLLQIVASFVKAHSGGSVVLLDGLERLITRNEFSHALKWVVRLSEFIAHETAIVLVPFSPDTVDPRELANLERALVTLDGSTLAEDLAVAELSRTLRDLE